VRTRCKLRGHGRAPYAWRARMSLGTWAAPRGTPQCAADTSLRSCGVRLRRWRAAAWHSQSDLQQARQFQSTLARQFQSTVARHIQSTVAMRLWPVAPAGHTLLGIASAHCWLLTARSRLCTLCQALILLTGACSIAPLHSARCSGVSPSSSAAFTAWSMYSLTACSGVPIELSADAM
jgi:hypothetical protein